MKSSGEDIGDCCICLFQATTLFQGSLLKKSIALAFFACQCCRTIFPLFIDCVTLLDTIEEGDLRYASSILVVKMLSSIASTVWAKADPEFIVSTYVLAKKIMHKFLHLKHNRQPRKYDGADSCQKVLLNQFCSSTHIISAGSSTIWSAPVGWTSGMSELRTEAKSSLRKARDMSKGIEHRSVGNRHLFQDDIATEVTLFFAQVRHSQSSVQMQDENQRREKRSNYRRTHQKTRSTRKMILPLFQKDWHRREYLIF